METLGDSSRLIRTVPHSIGMALVHQDWPCLNRTGFDLIGPALSNEEGL